MPDCQNSHPNLRSAMGVGMNPDENLSPIDSIVGSYGRTPPLDGRSHRNTIQGMPVAPGVAVGRAVVIQSPEDLRQIKSDSIMICSRMSLVYTIAFQAIRGIISETGGSMSTFATVAREYGLPVVTGVRSAPLVISDRDVVYMNGTDGSVQIVLEHCPEI